MAKSILKELKLDNCMIKEVSQLIYYHDYHIDHTINKVYVKKLLMLLDVELFKDLLKVQEADAKAQNPDKLKVKLEGIEKQKRLMEEVLKLNEPYKKSMMAITGNDLISNGIAQGKEIGTLLDRALEKIIKHPEYNEKEILLAYCKKHTNKN